MRILVLDTDSPAKHIGLYLTRPEAVELVGYVEDLLASPEGGGAHVHLSDRELTREITVALYDPSGDLSGFDRRSRALLENDV